MKIKLDVEPNQFEVENGTEVQLTNGARAILRIFDTRAIVFFLGAIVSIDTKTGRLHGKWGNEEVYIDLEALRPKPPNAFGYTYGFPTVGGVTLRLGPDQPNNKCWVHMPNLTPEKWEAFIKSSQVMLKRARFGWDQDLVAMLDAIAELGVRP